MSNVGFALPVCLVQPVTFFSFLYSAYYFKESDKCTHLNNQDSRVDHILYSIIPNWFDNSTMLIIGMVYASCTLSQLWTIRHVWTVKNAILAPTRQIFSVFSYDGLIIDRSLALSRWRNFSDIEMYGKLADKNDMEEASRKSTKISSKFEEDLVTKIYACATMWHETPEEMRDFLNSILRLDLDQLIRRMIQGNCKVMLPHYYELEGLLYQKQCYFDFSF